MQRSLLEPLLFGAALMLSLAGGPGIVPAHARPPSAATPADRRARSQADRLAETRAVADAGAVLEQFAHAWRGESLDTLKALLGPAEIRFRLDPPGRDEGGSGGDAPSYSAAQVFYMLQSHFAAVRTVDAKVARRAAVTPPDLAHGVLEVDRAVGGSPDVATLRLFVGMRRFAGGWRVVELRALP